MQESTDALMVHWSLLHIIYEIFRKIPTCRGSNWCFMFISRVKILTEERQTFTEGMTYERPKNGKHCISFQLQTDEMTFLDRGPMIWENFLIYLLLDGLKQAKPGLHYNVQLS